MKQLSKITLNVDGVLNGLPPFAARMDYEADGILWAVVDAEDSIVARVNGGEEMAEFYAAKFNELAATRQAPQTDGSLC